ncbi:MAG: hypothetical protein AMXMBFR53_44910 [Gemmatimonadota bacterium]
MRRDSLLLGLVILGVCLLLGLVESAQVRLGGGEVVETSWWAAFLRVLPSWIFLAGLSPLAVWASDRWPVRGDGWRRSLAVHLVLAFPFALALLFLVAVYGTVRPGSLGLGLAAGMGWLVSRFLVYAVLEYGALVGVVHAFRYRQEASAVRREAEGLVRELERARRQAVEGKLHPHFVFNTLNAITGLASRGDQPGVVRTLEAFSELLQAALDDRVLEPVPLREEVELLTRYLEIQQVRFGSRLKVEWDVDPAALEHPVPGLVLQPLVENALAHAIGRSRAGGTVTVRAHLGMEQLTLSVEDTGADPDPGPGRTGGRGIGLESTRARLAGLFGDAAGVELAPRDGGGSVATVTLPRRA